MLSHRAQIPCKLVFAAISIMWALITSCDRVCAVFPAAETAVLWLQCVSCVPPQCLTSWRVWRAQAGWSTSKLFWMQASSSPRSVWRLIPTVCLTTQYWFRCGFVCVLYRLCVSVKWTSSVCVGTCARTWSLTPRFTWINNIKTIGRWSQYHWSSHWPSSW